MMMRGVPPLRHGCLGLVCILLHPAVHRALTCSSKPQSDVDSTANISCHEILPQFCTWTWTSFCLTSSLSIAIALGYTS
ncbi:hypothetical protein F5141DRAFT_1157748 [Pisolithus sp. B1]|nr:hypothetical protein F5141DRAFT_1157748 [Pisolithus sp. B1]